MERVRFIEHLGTQILLVDCSHCTTEEFHEICDEVQATVTAQPPKSVLILSDFTGTEFDKATAEHLKLAAAYDRPHVLRSAMVGGEKMPDVYYRNLMSFSAREFPRFRTREEAMDWLVGQPAEKAAG